ncbi:hypothetical protein ACWD4V_16115 [Streptomyces tsukubensis]
MTLIYGDHGLMALSARISEWVPAHDISIERHETAWGERYRMARYTSQETGVTLAYVEWVDQETADEAWAEAVTAVLLDRIQRKLSGDFSASPRLRLDVLFAA